MARRDEDVLVAPKEFPGIPSNIKTVSHLLQALGENLLDLLVENPIPKLQRDGTDLPSWNVRPHHLEIRGWRIPEQISAIDTKGINDGSLLARRDPSSDHYEAAPMSTKEMMEMGDVFTMILLRINSNKGTPGADDPVHVMISQLLHYLRTPGVVIDCIFVPEELAGDAELRDPDNDMFLLLASQRNERSTHDMFR